MTLQQIIYTSLINDSLITGYTGNRIYHKHLPIDFKINQITTVFILDSSSSEGSFDDFNDLEIINVNIKLNYYKSLELYELAELVKDMMKKIDNVKIKYVEFMDDSLVYNPNFEFYNLNLRFSIHYSK